MVGEIITCTTDSRLARAKISAHETIPGQFASRDSLMLSTMPYPRRELRLGLAYFSLTIVEELSSSTDASHPYKDIHESYVRTLRVNPSSSYKTGTEVCDFRGPGRSYN